MVNRKGKNMRKINSRFYDRFVNSKLILYFFLHIANKLIMLTFIINIRENSVIYLVFINMEFNDGEFTIGS